ncbi:PREDICTED: uncharacterized protein LOC104586267 [Nelumbo nucifera]|uniref:Uncharacterized protein LOC104586267 n=1 Tax=Nelumbo nucifera TaxID=4432 RepID=A0A1U7YP25_NELNU|nr:PREDICTED: uncharacterized protein LOC104586267 [Nelumbo nucifera]
MTYRGKQPAAETLMTESIDLHDELRTQHDQPIEDLIQVPLSEKDPEKTVRVSSLLDNHLHEDLIQLLREHTDVFAWSAADMPGIDPKVITHCLNSDPLYRPIRQKKMSFATERWQIINEEVQKLLDAGFIQEVKYPDWLANVVMVKKANGKWRICIDFNT